MSKNFVIRATDGETGKVTGYWAYDRDSGYPYWGWLSSARFYSQEEALKIIETDTWLNDNRTMVDRDGNRSVWPAVMVHNGAQLNIGKMSGSVNVEIVEIIQTPVFSKVFTAKLPI